MPENCFFCTAVKDEQALVCPACSRDTAIPAPLAAEHQALTQKRDRLRGELVAARERLALRRRKPISA
jgi:hypothetical protein